MPATISVTSRRLASIWKHLKDLSLVRSEEGMLMAELAVANTGAIALTTNPSLQPISGRTCSSNLGIQFRRSSNANTLYFAMVVAANDSSKVYDYSVSVIVANNTTFNFTHRLPTNLSIRVIIYEYDAYSFRGRQLVVSSAFSACSYTTSRRLQLTVNPPATTSRPIARFELDTYCPTSRLFYYHEGRIQYKKADDPNDVWADLGLARRSGSTITEIVSGVPSLPPVATPSYSYLETDRLENGVTYKFRVTISGTPRRVRGLHNSTVTQTFVKTRKFDVTEFETLTSRTPATYTYLKFKRSYWLANSDTKADPCALWRY